MTSLSHYIITVKEHGRINLPKELRVSLGLQEGDTLIFRLRPDGSAEVVTTAVLARRGRGLFADLSTDTSETDDFLAARRLDARP